MVCRMLFFDYRESEKSFFEQNKFNDFDMKFFENSLNEDTVKNLSEDDLEMTTVISVFITSQITDKVLEKFKNLRIISTRSTGFDHIDIQKCVDKNIAVVNVEAYGSSSVAQFTFGMILMLIRKFLPAIKSVENRVSTLGCFTGRNLDTMTIGVVGTGFIGAGVCAIANSFGMKILAYDFAPKKELEAKYNIKYVKFDELLKKSDIVTLHIPYSEENYHLMDKEKFELMKQNSYFINVSRGELVNLEDLLNCVTNGKFSGVGLDVVACLDLKSENGKENILERSSLMCLEDSPIVHELNKLSNVIITPHIAYDTQESVDYILNTTFLGLKDCLCGGKKHRVI